MAIENERPIVNDLEISEAHIFAKNFKGDEKKRNGKVVNSAGTRKDSILYGLIFMSLPMA